MTSRREFMASAGAVVAVSALPAMAGPYGWTTPPNWFDKPMRWAQMVFTEDDPGNNLDQNRDPVVTPSSLRMGSLSKHNRATLIIPEGVVSAAASPVLRHKQSGLSMIGFSPAQVCTEILVLVGGANHSSHIAPACCPYTTPRFLRSPTFP